MDIGSVEACGLMELRGGGFRRKRIGDFAQKLQGEYHNLQVAVPNNVVYLFCFNRFRE